MKKNCQEDSHRREFLLPAPISGLSGNKEKMNRAKVCSILSELGELNCEACIMGMKANALIDTGASVSQVNEVMNKLEVKPSLSEADLVISQADGSQMEIEGKISCPIKVGGVEVNYALYVASELCAGLILGEDWLKTRKTHLEFKPAKLILGKVDVPLGGKEKVTLVVVVKEDIKIPPRAMVSCRGKILNAKVEGEIHRVTQWCNGYRRRKWTRRHEFKP